MFTEPFIEGQKVLEKIESHQHEAYFVGGCVRDLLLNRKIGDIDIATSALPEEIQEIFPKVIPVGIEHGTVIVRFNHMSYEVTTFRVDGKYSDQRHPDHVQFIDRIDEDLQRRDFTINALAMNKAGHMIDLFSGKDDLTKKIIRTVGDGRERFTEDPLRIIRALRFSSQLGFLIEAETLENIHQIKNQITTLAIERITNEFTKLFAADYVQYGIDYLKETAIYNYLPILSKHPHIIEQFPKKISPLMSFGEVIAHFHYIDPKISISKWASAWKCSNKIKKEAIKLIEALQYYEQNGFDQWLVYQLDPLYYDGVVRLINHFNIRNPLIIDEIKETASKLSIRSKQDLAFTGKDLIAIFPTIKAGPWIHQTLTNIEKEVVFKRLSNTKKDIKEWIICNPPVIS